MRKIAAAPSTPGADWLDVPRVATVRASSGQKAHPVEAAFALKNPPGWRASRPGEQVICVTFRRPTTLRRVRVVFTETAVERTQEFTLRWSSHRGETHREILRQQFNFAPAGATQEIEEYEVALPDVGWLELRIVPDVRGGDALAGLAEFRLA